MADTYGSLGSRVMQLEYQIKAMAQREKKEMIWKSSLESWILKNFNYDLRLEVQLKLLQSETGESGDFETLEKNLSQSPNRIFMGQTSITKTRNSAPTTPTSISSAARNINIGQSRHGSSSSSPIRQISPNRPNVSITTMPAPRLSSYSQSQGYHQSPRNTQRGSGYMSGVPRTNSQEVRQTRPAQVQVQKRRRIANNVGNRMQIPDSTLYSRDMPTPIIISTSSMAPKKPNKSPELIVLDDEEEDRVPPIPNVGISIVNPASSIGSSTVSSFPTPSTSSTTATCPLPGVNCSTTVGSHISRSDITSSSGGTCVTSSIPCNSNTSQNNNCSSTNSFCPFGGVGNSGVNISGTNSFATFSNCIGTATSGNCPYKSTPGTSCSAIYSSPYDGSGISNFGSNTSSAPYISSSGPTPTGVDDNNSCTTSDNGGGDSENSNGFDPSYQLINMLQLESHYAASNYLTRNEGILMFNVRKILLEYEPSLHTELTQITPGHEEDLPASYKKRINANVCHFLMQVYGEQVPTVAKQGMADSLFDAFPGIPKDEWFKKVPHKNATGCINSRLSSLRKNLRDQRKRVEEDPSLVLV